MPINKYFGGHGSEVMSDMTSKHGAKKGKQVFYATANKRKQNPGDVQEHGSLEDITALENSTGDCKVVSDEFTHPVHKGYKIEGTFGELDPPAHDGSGAAQFTKGKQSCNRDIGQSVHYGAPIVYHGPDTDYRAEEIDLEQYGRSYEPIPLKDFFKTEEKMEERTFRLREQDEYDEEATPGAVPDKPLKSSESYGASGFREDETELDDNRSFDSQREFARGVKKNDGELPLVKGIDRKKGNKLR
jgi:hypothetical protein